MFEVFVEVVIASCITLFADDEDLEKAKAAVLAAKDRMSSFKMQPVEFEKV